MQRIGFALWIVIGLLVLASACSPAAMSGETANNPVAGPTEATQAPSGGDVTPEIEDLTPATELLGGEGGSDSITVVAATAVLGGDDVSGDEGAEAVIELARSGGLAGVKDRWTIYADGRIEGGNDGSVPPEQVAATLTAISDLGFFDMAGEYDNPQCADCFEYVLTVRHNGQEKTVHAVDSAPGAPAELDAVIQAVLMLVNG